MIKKVLIFTISIAVLIFILKAYNNHAYKNKGRRFPKYFSNVKDISLYPTNLENISVKYIDNGSFQGFHFKPKDIKYEGIVVLYGGSEGSPNFENAKRLAELGFETLAVFMFGMKNQPKTLVKIPLEQFEDVLSYIKDVKPITVFGASKGAEYALNLAAKYEQISNVILIAPSAYNFSGLDFNNYGSSWTSNSKELPFIDIKKSSFLAFLKNIIIPGIINAPVKYLDSYESAISYDKNLKEKKIDVRNIKADILMIVGEDDKMWPSKEMANVIKKENPNAILHSFSNAGHIFEGDGIINLGKTKILTGGNLEENKKALLKSNEIINEFLKNKHNKINK